MSSWSYALTNKGRQLQAKAQAGAQLVYTRMAVGSGTLSGQSLESMTALIAPIKDLNITRLKRPAGATRALIGATLTNQDVTTGFYLREIGIFATDPDDGEILYMYANSGATADYIAPQGDGVIEKALNMNVFVGSAANITANIDESLVYATQQDLADAIAGIQINDATTTQKGITQLSSATDSTSEAMAATPKAVKAAYDRANAAFTSASDGKGKVRDAITGVKGTVADADGDGIPTFDELAAGVKTIPAGYTADATAAAGDIRAGKSAYKNGVKENGSLVTQATGAQTVTPGPSDIVKGAGIYDGAITIKGVPVNPDALLVGNTVAGTPGRMPNRSAENNHMPGLESTVWPGDRVFIRPPNGYFNGATWVTAPVPGLTPGNLREGVDVLGIVGTLQEGKKFYKQDISIPAYGKVDFDINIGFNWSVVLLIANSEDWDGGISSFYLRHPEGSLSTGMLYNGNLTNPTLTGIHLYYSNGNNTTKGIIVYAYGR